MKAQASIEFIVTYGFAILTVIAAVGALSYFGITNYNNMLPGRCDFPLDLACTEEPIIEQGAISFSLMNNLQNDIYIRPDQVPWTLDNDASGGYMAGMLIYTKRVDGSEQTCRYDPKMQAVSLDGKVKEPEPCLVKVGDPVYIKVMTNNELSEDSRVTTNVGFTYTSARTDSSFTASGEISGRVA